MGALLITWIKGETHHPEEDINFGPRLAQESESWEDIESYIG